MFSGGVMAMPRWVGRVGAGSLGVHAHQRGSTERLGAGGSGMCPTVATCSMCPGPAVKSLHITCIATTAPEITSADALGRYSAEDIAE